MQTKARYMNQYDTMTITEEQAKRYKFPAKAVGYWAIIEETEEQMVLHRLTKNGQLGSDRPNNILKVKKLDFSEIFKSEKSQDEKVLTATASDGKEVVIVRSRTVDISDNADEALRFEFNLPYPDGSRMGLVDEAISAFKHRYEILG